MASSAAITIELAVDCDSVLPPVSEHQSVEFRCAVNSGAWLAFTIDGVLQAAFLHPGETTWRWNWNPGVAVGLHELVLAITDPDGTTRRCRYSLRVAPRKLDQERYELLVEDIQQAVHAIVYALSGASIEGAVARSAGPPWERSRLEEYYLLFEERLDVFVRSIRRISTRPREQLRSGAEAALLGRAHTPGPDLAAEIARGTFDEAPADVAAELQAALRPGGGLLPQSIPTAQSRPTFDIYEHRLLKQLLDALLRRARFIGVIAEREAERLLQNERLAGMASTRLARARRIAEGCVAAQRVLRDLRSQPFLAEVRPLAAFRGPTPLLQRDANYREIYRMWQALQKSALLAFDSPLFTLPITDLPRLYEVWCVLQVVQAALALSDEVREQQIVAFPKETEATQLAHVLDLTEHAPMLVLARNGATITLRYHPRYRPLDGNATSTGSLDRHTRVPDLAIEIERPGAPMQIVVLDAKYRLDADGRNVPQDALADAYAYLGAIGAQGRRRVAWALLAYPGNTETELYPSGVGAIPLLPGQTEKMHKALKCCLEDVIT